ncbi:MAG: hypothetical protein KAQ62_02210 [Cyclobacteriaceae bacterium]|nr:hypothetical protein [Cyclobacteriaceae bacterium]MCK5705155.1 hypothetical protein [Cyclobacteriaceae bacterium]
MRKSINICLFLALAFSLSLNISAQSTEKELDQVELMKQFIGTWEAETGKDSVTVLLFTPINNGLHILQEDKANEETYVTYKGVFGLSDDKQMIFGAAPAPDGTMIIDYGKFETKNKYKIDRYLGNTSHVAQMLEWEFLTPGSFVIRAKWRGNGMTWSEDWVEWFTFNKID